MSLVAPIAVSRVIHLLLMTPGTQCGATQGEFTVAAIIMSFYLLTTSFVTTVLIPAAEFHTGGSTSSTEDTHST